MGISYSYDEKKEINISYKIKQIIICIKIN